VHDVAVGKYDMCGAGFWMTTERITYRDILKKPFAPFDFRLWLLTTGFLLFSALVMLLTDSQNEDDYPNQGFTPRVFKSLYFSFFGCVGGGSANAPLSVPGRLAQLDDGGGVKNLEEAIDKGMKIR